MQIDPTPGSLVPCGLVKQDFLIFLFPVREHYVDFGPTLANEKLEARHDVIVSTETLRGWMIEDGIWTLRSRRRRIHQPRARRECFGEMKMIVGTSMMIRPAQRKWVLLQ